LGWIGHTLQKPRITKQALTWNSHGKRKRGRLKNSWRCDLIADIEELGRSCKEIEKMAQDPYHLDASALETFL